MTKYKQFGRREQSKYVKEYSIIEVTTTLVVVTIEVFMRLRGGLLPVREITKSCLSIPAAQQFITDTC